MDLFSGLIVVGFCVVGTIVALLADNLGRKLGKKRLTFWGLRPRHTATLLTGAAGFLIPLVTVLLMAASSSEVRTILREGSQLRTQRDKAREALVVANTDLEKKSLDVQSKKAEIESLGSRLDVQNKAVRAKTAEAKALTGQVSGLRADMGRVRNDFARIRAQVGQLRPQLVRARGEYQSLLAKTKVANVQLLNVNGELRAVNDRATTLDIQNRDLERKIKTKESEILALTGQQKRISAEFDEAKTQYTRALQLLDTEKGKATAELAAMRNEFEALQTEVQDLQTVSMSLQVNAQSARTKNLVFGRFDELARLKVPAGLTQADAEVHLQAALQQARKEASRRGAKPDDNGQTAALITVQYKDQQKSPENQLADASKALVGNKDSMVILVNALFNSFQEEFVPVVLQVRQNPIVYRLNDVIAEARIDGSVSHAEIIKALEQFLTVELRQAATKKGMIAANGRSLGELGPDQLIKLVADIRSTGRRIRVIAVATRETRAAEDLELEFRFR